MNALSRFDPFRDFWPEAFGRFPSAALRVPEGMPAEIRLDVSETASAYEVRAEIPGARKEDIHVRVDGNRVSISAERKQEREQKEGERVLLRELVSGSVARSFQLAQDLDEREVKARLEDGVLRLTLPKRSGGGARRVEIE
ncbi:MAG: Hsp20/alpha crystallin family protein [Burkholderiales bacterium]|uniref:Hsp20/alpha crystallin family protein n=1 Tax=Inhella sp. TaxID=1921806 RepID=UPI001AD4B1BB|nr:Hsp20/alpha crystallin family protein [Burkholderiales bacterium]